MDTSRRAEVSVQAFAGAVAAALQPLFAGMTELLDNADERGAGAFALRALALRGTRLADELRAYAGQLLLQPQCVAPDELLHSLAQTLRRALDARYDIQVHIDEASPACHADAQALQDALGTLALNACEAMQAGGRLVLGARAARLDGGVPAVEWAVMDTGPSVPVSMPMHAPFIGLTPGQAMAGLALAAVDGFARQSGGALKLQGTPGGGACASLLLPAAQPDGRLTRRA